MFYNYFQSRVERIEAMLRISLYAPRGGVTNGRAVMAINTTRGGSRSRIFAEINVTPLTDVFLVLLVIFMITTSMMMESAADVDLPSATETTTETRGSSSR